MEATDAAWTAGIIDGEGSLLVHRSGLRPPSARLAVGNTDERMIGRLRDLWGGPVYDWQPPQPKRKHMYRWAVSGHRLGVVLRAVLPYLVTKRERAEDCLAVIEKMPHKPRTKWSATELRSLSLSIRRSEMLPDGSKVRDYPL